MISSSTAEISNNIRYIIIAARKLRGYTQIELSKKLGISQGLVSKLEKGSLQPSAILWFEVCQSMNIDWDCQVFGYIDELGPTVHSKFIHSKKYGAPYTSSVRSLKPLLDILRLIHGDTKYYEYLAKEGFRPEYFYYLGNKVSFTFFLKVLKNVNKLLRSRSNINLDQFLMTRNIHGKMYESLLTSTHEESSKLSLFCQNASNYEENFNYSFEKTSQKKSLLFANHNQPIIEQSIIKEDILNQLDEYKSNYLKNYLNFNSGTKHFVSKIECGFKDQSNRCIYQIENL